MAAESLSPAEPRGRRVRAQARFEAEILVRNGEQILVALVLPVLALLALVASPYPELPEPRIALVAPGVLALAVVSTAFTGQAIQTGFDRRYGVLRLLATSPVGTDGLLAGKALAVAGVVVGQLLVLGLIAAVAGWRPDPMGLLVTPVSGALGVWVFVALALLLAGVLRAEAVLAVANLVWVLLAGAGGLLLPGDTVGGLDAVVRWLPSGALGDAFRDGLTGAGIPLVPWLVLVAWGVVLSLAVVRTFRWRD
ncbi:ABC transporter permease [Janibacter indicus]|uniref:ABC transporter permease n=1 Tax=Janibacter indicus TaxID=857417 RepID=A0A7L9IXC3_9MICO|nr:ABC transporter permease [Janibacter indicus]QOK21433.1 ABC transporter permease [Janibacter indicus]